MLLGFLAGSLLFALTVGALGRAPRGFRRRRAYPEKPVSSFGLFDAVQARLGRTPFDRMNPVEQRYILDLLWRADAEDVDDGIHARIQILLGEIVLSAGRKREAAEHFRNALRWEPQAPVRRTLESLESPLEAALLRRAA